MCNRRISQGSINPEGDQPTPLNDAQVETKDSDEGMIQLSSQDGGKEDQEGVANIPATTNQEDDLQSEMQKSAGEEENNQSRPIIMPNRRSRRPVKKRGELAYQGCI